MARIRTIKPEFWSDEKLSPLTDTIRLLFLGLIGMADDYGRLLDSPKQIEAFVWPFADRSRECREGLSELTTRGRISRGKTESGQAVIQIVNWARHQKVDKPNTKGSLPPIVDQSAGESVASVSRELRERLASDSRELRENGASGSRLGADGVATDSRSDLDPDLDRDPEQEQRARRENVANKKPPASELTTAQRLAIAANKAITDKFGEQTRPLLPGHAKTVELATLLGSAGIPVELAESSIVRQVQSLAAPVRTMSYFRPGVVDDWESQQANAAAAASPGISPLNLRNRHGRTESRVPPGGGSPPAPDDGVVCRTCGTTETHIANRRIVPKHREGCALGTATAHIGSGASEKRTDAGAA